jgi:hypothetical protein
MALVGAADDVLVSPVTDSAADEAALVAEDTLLSASSLEHADMANTAAAAKPAVTNL